MNSSSAKLPRRIKVQSIQSSRYDAASRPASWDARVSGVDVVLDESGESLKLCSEAGQNTPQPGWVILLMSGDADAGYCWTLYGMPDSARSLAASS